MQVKRQHENRRKMRLESRLLVALLIGLHIIFLAAAFIAPYDPAAQNRELPYAPPTRLHFRDASGFHLRPFVYLFVATDSGYREDTSHGYLVQVFVRGDTYSFLSLFETNLHLLGVDDPAKLLLLGTDAFGRDEFSRVLYGGQVSLAAGIVATFVTLLVGSIVGVIAGYYGGWVDETLMGASELFLSLPWLYFLLGVRAFLPLHVSPVRTFVLLTCIIGLIGWARPARLTRGVVLTARTKTYVLAARGFGASNFYLIRRHILPDTYSVFITQAALLIPRFIAAEVALSFFGLGVNEPIPSWGNMLSALQQYSVLISYTWLLAPAAALFVTSVIYFLVADALQSRLKSELT
jgi:peptide/nickel transport system permease protein